MSGSKDSIIRVPPHFFLHILDNNKNITRVEVGPQTFVRLEHEAVVLGPERMVTIPPRHFCRISNPALRDQDGALLTDAFGQVRIRHGDEEIRFSQDPFPLFPGEKLASKITPLQVLPPNKALRLRATRAFTSNKGEIQAGQEWMFEGPGTYLPQVEVEQLEVMDATIVKPNEALKLRARRECLDKSGRQRRAGEVWLWQSEGAYLPTVDEEIIDVVQAYVLTERTALHVRATRTFTDVFKKMRKAGQEWLVTLKDAETYIPGVYEEVICEVPLTSLSNRQYCVVLDPVDASGVNRMGQRELRKGDVSFFLFPGETLQSGVLNIHVLGEDDGLLVRARESFDEHKPGDRWMVLGPCDYVPPVEVEIVEKRKAIPLDENEGVYVRDTRSGKVRSVSGMSYMLEPYEELWEKDLPPSVEKLLTSDLDPLADRSSTQSKTVSSTVRDRTRVVTYRVPHNAAVQIYDFKAKRARIVFGPELVMLGADEHFTQISLSGGKPKKTNQIRSLVLLLGPDFMTDVVTVETSDHARLSLTLSYNWQFQVDKSSSDSAEKIFSVPDFIGDACKAIASRVRGCVAQVPFDVFHRESAGLIRTAVFGTDAEGLPRDQMRFESNNLVISTVDIQSVEPVDQKTRDSLQKSVQLAIEITTTSQEAAARHEAERREQEARGKLERQKILDQAESEKSRANLLLLQAQSAAVESTGQAKAEAQARAEAAEIEGTAGVKQAQLRANAMKIEAEADLEQTKQRQEAEITHRQQLDQLEVDKAEKMSKIAATKFQSVVSAIGADTIRAIAQAGPEMQAKLLAGLGVKSLLITDGNSPINLFNTANGLVGMPGQ
eukprot:c17840_g1_i1.p1 GENE.c17840_g1_i1~~c17840_g1_i1.p1  ORF type:complete len:842 (+),score=235.96 c17840_g1_i1:27-2528(+)